MKGDAPHALDVAIGQRIRERRRALGVSQEALGKALGITFQQVQKYERGANRISFSRLMAIAEALRCRLRDLVDELDDSPEPTALGRLTVLLAHEGALEMLEAYAAIPGRALRRALLSHARALSGLEDVAAGQRARE
jgi:transcriptional regulator with XRE-family HTH domain